MAKETQSFQFALGNGTVAEISYTNPAQLNQMWGSIASQMGGSGIMGEHSSSHGTFTPDPGDGGRQGVGNLSKDDVRFDNPLTDGGPNVSDGGQGLHAVFQASRLGDPNLPPGAIEATVGPFEPVVHGNVHFDIIG